MAAHIVIALQKSYHATFNGGDAYNVTPQTAQLSGTVRAFTREVMSLIEIGMRRVVKGTAEAFGATAEVDFRS